MIAAARRALGAYRALPGWLLAVPVCGWAGLIWWASSSAGPASPVAPGWALCHNAAHVVVFGVLAALLFLSIDGSTAWRGLAACAGAISYGAVDEWHQGFVAGRHPSAWDVLSDATGALLFTAAIVWLQSGERRAVHLVLALLPLSAVSVGLATWF